MSKLIVEMEYPKNGCSECRLKYKKRGYGGVFYCFNHLCVDKWTYGRTQNGDRPSWCPIKGVLPEEHGDLIDRDVSIQTFKYIYIEEAPYSGFNGQEAFYTPEDVVNTLLCQDVVIAAERKDET